MQNFLASLAGRFTRLTNGTKLIATISAIVIFLGIIVKAQNSNSVNQPINGEWQCISHGTEDVNVPFTLHLQASSGRMSGWLSVSSGSIPLTSMSYSKGQLNIELDTNSGQYALTAVVNGDRLNGTWKKNGQQVGTWEGEKGSGTHVATHPVQSPFKAISTLDVPTIQGRPVELDSKGMLLPWPRPHHIGFSYAGYFMSRWQYLWEQYNHQRYYDFYCCIDYDRETFVTYPIRDWANSTGYLRAHDGRLH